VEGVLTAIAVTTSSLLAGCLGIPDATPDADPALRVDATPPQADVLYFPFEGGGSAALTNRVDGDVVPSVDPMIGPRGDGRGDALLGGALVLDDLDLSAPPLTIEAWVRRGDAAECAAVVTDFEMDELPAVEVGLEIRTDGKAMLMVGAATLENGYAYAVGGPDLRDEAWHHIAAVWDGVEVLIYVDAIPTVVPLAAAPEPAPRTQGYFLGRRPNLGCPFDDDGGALDEVKVSRRLKSDDEIARSMEYQAP
jgi:hypothetical protein